MRKELQELGSGKSYTISGYSSKNLKVYHGRIDWDVAKRFLHSIYAEGAIKKTSLAMKAGVNYSTCCRYIMWFAEINWIEDDGDEIRLAEAGLQVYARIMEEKDVDNSHETIS